MRVKVKLELSDAQASQVGGHLHTTRIGAYNCPPFRPSAHAIQRSFSLPARPNLEPLGREKKNRERNFEMKPVADEIAVAAAAAAAMASAGCSSMSVCTSLQHSLAVC